MVDRYNTGDPRPSNSMKNLSDNALAFDDFVNSDGDNAVDRFGKEFPTISKLIKNVDETFSSQLSIQESTFSESQTDKENRFQQFLNTSGYVLLGDYQDGPFQFSARNQYIRYDNQYYCLNAATDVGFTTTGTDATSFANDVTHFVLMDGDTLRQNLGSGDGLKLVGQCSDLTALRTIEPTNSNQRISVAAHSPGWAALTGAPVGGGEFYYDPHDTSSADDDIFIFVTVGGKRWKRACSGKKICLEWKGVRPGDDAAPALNAIGTYLNNRAIAKGTVSGLPRVHVGAGVYPLSDTVKLTYAFRIK
ncbi:TPA: hypothetical protein QFT19_005954, partial [Klebsiella variicola]|nr:hypothetical protein [Klebsiella variicola]